MKTFISTYPVASALIALAILGIAYALYRKYRNTQDASANNRTNVGVVNASELTSPTGNSFMNYLNNFTSPPPTGGAGTDSSPAGSNMRMGAVKGH